MSKKLAAAQGNAERTKATAARRNERLAATRERMAELVSKAEAAVKAAEERLTAVKAKAAELIAKREAEAKAAEEKANVAAEKAKLAESRPTKSVAPAGTVQTEDGR